MKEFTGHLLVSFRHREHTSVIADIEITIFGLPGQGEIKIRRVAVMKKADGEKWIAWPRDKYESAGKGTQFYNYVTGSSGGAPYALNAWLLAEYEEWLKTAPPLVAKKTPFINQDAEPISDEIAGMFERR